MALVKNNTSAETRMLWHLLNDLANAKASENAILLADTLDELDVLSKMAESVRVQQIAADAVAAQQTADTGAEAAAIRD